MSAQQNNKNTQVSTHEQPQQSQSLHPKQSVHVQAEFQKNYPKNLFIPIIQYLTQLGYKQAYEKCIGSKLQFQSKNVVSLSSIYTLITQDWFRRNINNQHLLMHISNKILLNSKIKKKLFHLLIGQIILMTAYSDLKDFKRRVSKQANMIARKSIVTDQLFDYPNSIIYLLHVFLKILLFHANKKEYNKMEDQISKNNVQQQGAQAKVKNQGSKQQYKSYVKDIVHIFSGKGLSIHNLTDILEEVKQNIMEKDRQLRQKYHLIQGIPRWALFIEIVIIRCFQYKKKDMKITNFIFNQWTNEFKNKMLNVFDKNTQISIKETVNNNVKQGSLSEWQANGMKDIQMMTKNLNFGGQNWVQIPQISMIAFQNGDQQIIDKKQDKESPQINKKNVKQFSPIVLSNFMKK